MLLDLKEHRLYPAAKRLDVILSGYHDIFAADVHNHQSCYLKFSTNSIQPKTNDKEQEKMQKQDDVLLLFKFKLRTKIIRDHEAFLLHKLLRDIASISTEQGLEDPPIHETSTLRRQQHCRVWDLRDSDIVRSSGKLIKRKLEEKKRNTKKWPLTPEELLSQMDEGPLPDLYNAIYFSKYEHGKLNEHGYAMESAGITTKIWFMAGDWETFVTGESSMKQIVLGLYLHRITGSKEGINALHKCNHLISYNKICDQNSAWARMASSRSGYYPSLRKGVVTHSTLDNNDGRPGDHDRVRYYS